MKRRKTSIGGILIATFIVGALLSPNDEKVTEQKPKTEVELAEEAKKVCMKDARIAMRLAVKRSIISPSSVEFDLGTELLWIWNSNIWWL